MVDWFVNQLIKILRLANEGVFNGVPYSRISLEIPSSNSNGKTVCLSKRWTENRLRRDILIILFEFDLEEQHPPNESEVISFLVSMGMRVVIFLFVSSMRKHFNWVELDIHVSFFSYG